MSSDPHLVSPDRQSLSEMLSDGGLRVLFQPIVDLRSGVAVGVEALCRGPEGSRWEDPLQVFAAAKVESRVTEVDWASRMEALQAAVDARARTPMTLFVNAEPEALLSAPPRGFGRLRAALTDAGVRVVLEVTERELANDPAALLAALPVVRRWGWSVALDDVGAEPASLALLPFLRPDVVKLDMRLIQQRTTVAVAETVNAVLAHAERTGALLLAEGIETHEQQRLAEAMGATVGQGWLYGGPGPLLSLPWQQLEIPPRAPARAALGTPWQVIEDRLAFRRSRKPLITAMSHTLERQAVAGGKNAVVLAAFQNARHFDAGTALRFTTLAGVSSFVAAFGEDFAPVPAEGVRGTRLEPGDPLVAEWVVTVLGPHFAAALVARDLGDPGPESRRRFDYVLTYDRELVTDIATSLMARAAPRRTAPAAPQRRGRSAPETFRSPTPQVASALTDAGVLRQILDELPWGVTLADASAADQPLVYVNPAFSALTGYPQDEVLGRNCRFLQADRTDPEAVAAIGSYVRQGIAVNARLLNERADGSTFWNELTIRPVGEAGQPRLLMGVQTDVSAEVAAERRAAYLERHDPLTGLLNRDAFCDLLEEELQRSRRGGTRTVVLKLDLQRFRRLNETFGMRAADAVLQEVGLRVSSTVLNAGQPSRFYGDLFAVLIPGVAGSLMNARRICASTSSGLREALDPAFRIAGAEVSVRTRVGAAVWPEDGSTIDLLLGHAARMLREGH